ncbi:MAG TPA: hypothetical protein VKJ00_05800 [Thermoanaerobaculia bacterium]|nr:hypothetical protein [Thermoanaerobaculia bacterium]
MSGRKASGPIGRISTRFVALIFILLPLRAFAQTPSSDEWKFTVGLYVWLPTINADLRYGLPPGQPGNPNVEIGPNSYLTHLNVAIPVVAEARKGDFSIFTDFFYASLTNEASRIRSIEIGPDRFPIPTALNLNTETKIEGLALTLVGGYTVAKSPDGNLDVIAGFRYFEPKATTDWNLTADFTLPDETQTFSKTGSISARQSLWDGIVGVRGRIRAGEKWFFPYYADIGGGTSKLTWQAYGGVGYAIGSFDLALLYRHLSYEGKDDKLIQKLNLGGGALAFLYHF